jgi:hypothetical protein
MHQAGYAWTNRVYGWGKTRLTRQLGHTHSYLAGPAVTPGYAQLMPAGFSQPALQHPSMGGGGGGGGAGSSAARGGGSEADTQLQDDDKRASPHRRLGGDVP